MPSLTKCYLQQPCVRSLCWGDRTPENCESAVSKWMVRRSWKLQFYHINFNVKKNQKQQDTTKIQAVFDFKLFIRHRAQTYTPHLVTDFTFLCRQRSNRGENPTESPRCDVQWWAVITAATLQPAWASVKCLPSLWLWSKKLVLPLWGFCAFS